MSGVSVLFLPVSQILLRVFGVSLDNCTVGSRLVAAAVANFVANKHFVGGVTSCGNLRGQARVFWVVMLGVSLARLLIHVVARRGRSDAAWQRPRMLAAQLLGYGTVWVGRFLILDSWLFEFADQTPDYPIAEESSDRLICLPFYKGLGQDDQDKLIRAIQEFDV
jgi:hypothetical protein